MQQITKPVRLEGYHGIAHNNDICLRICSMIEDAGLWTSTVYIQYIVAVSRLWFLLEDLDDWEVKTGCHLNRTSAPQLMETLVSFSWLA